jgi:hypothetical protein
MDVRRERVGASGHQPLGHDKITDAAVLMGFYTRIALTLNFYDVPAGPTAISRRDVPNAGLP